MSKSTISTFQLFERFPDQVVLASAGPLTAAEFWALDEPVLGWRIERPGQHICITHLDPLAELLGVVGCACEWCEQARLRR